MPFFNRSNNEDLILVVQSAGVSRGRNGFFARQSGKPMIAKINPAKNSQSPKLSVYRIRSAAEKEHLLEHRTDGSDAFDTLYIGCEKFPYHDTYSVNISGIS